MMRVSILAHASVLIEMGEDRILVDPIFADTFGSDTLCFYPQRELDEGRLVNETTAIVVTHIHLDHYHPATLERFPRHVPIFVPPHDALKEGVLGLGFENVTVLPAWARHELQGGAIVATPSNFEIDELGVLALSADGDAYWHMSDAIVTEKTGREVRADYGPVGLVAVKHQPLRTLIGYQRGLQAMMLDRDELVDAFEAACAAEPACVFPYFSGFAFHGEHAWANRHVSPYSATDIAGLLRERLGEEAAVETVQPGDVLEVRGRSVQKLSAASPLARLEPGGRPRAWEPIDASTLRGLPNLAEVMSLTLALRRVMESEVFPWVVAHVERGTGLFDAYREYGGVWQAIIHVGEGRRLHHAIDFRGPELELYLDHRHPEANVFAHIAGGPLREVLDGKLGPEVFWMAGAYRIYEKLLFVKDGRFREPDETGWALLDRLPDPITFYLRKVPR
jgi:UDP-MurNAc hydroxylase